MAVPNEKNKIVHNGDDVTTVFTTDFTFAANAEVAVTHVDSSANETLWVEGTQYNLTGAGTGIAGSITVVTSPTDYTPATGEDLVAQLKPGFTQPTGLPRGGSVSPKGTLEPMHDKRVRQILQLKDDVDNAVKAPIGETTIGRLPVVASRGTYLLGFDAAGDPVVSATTVAELDTLGLGGVTQHLGGDGTVSLPYYSFSADPDTGFYRIGANNFGAAVNGTKILDIDVSGINGALGQTTPAAAAVTTLSTTGDVTSGGDVLSDTDSTDSLGSTAVRWLKAWIDSIQTTANVDVGGDLTVTGNLTVNGTTVTNDATNTVIKDPLIGLNEGAASNANDLGMIFERGSTGDNGFMGWDESGDYFAVGTTTATASSTGNISYTLAEFRCGNIIATGGTLAGLTSFGMSAGATITDGVLDEDTMASDSAAALATQQSIKAYVDANAPENGVKFAFESTTTDTDQGAGKVWLNHATPSSATMLYVDDVEAGAVSVNAWVDTWDDVTNAVASGYIYIASYGTTNALLVYKVTGAVTSASTYSKIAVTHVLTVGTISDGDDIGLTFVPAGQDGSGTMNDLVDDLTPQQGGPLDTNNFAINTSRATVASHATTGAIWAALGNEIDWTGTETTTDFPDAPRAGASRILHCAGASSFTNSATLAIDGAADYTAAAGDIVIVHALTVSTFRLHVIKADGTAVVAAAGGGTLGTEVITTSGTTATFTVADTTNTIILGLNGISSTVHAVCGIRIGDAGGIETTGYLGMLVNGVTPFYLTDRWGIDNALTSYRFHSGNYIIQRIDAGGLTWSITGQSSADGAGDDYSVQGKKTLSAQLTQLQVYVASGAFDAGSINVTEV